jgi:hypothetical protein
MDSVWETQIWNYQHSTTHGQIRLQAIDIKNADMEFEKLHADEISDYLIRKDSTKFWKARNSCRNISDIPVSVAGKSDPVDNANEFKSFFDGIYVSLAVNTYAVDEYVELRDTGAGCKADYLTFGVETLENCVNKLKLGRAAGVDGITAEHIIHSFRILYIST